jgi:hypothetical protein
LPKEIETMTLSSIWRRLTARRRRRRDSFYDTQHVMRRAIASEADGKPGEAPVAVPDKERDRSGDGR